MKTLRHMLSVIAGLLIGGVLFTGCYYFSADRADREDVQDQQEHYRDAQPIPFIDYSLERDVVIQLYVARQEEVATYTVWRGALSVIEGHCPSIGFPIPYDTSITNPMQMPKGTSVVLEQPEPNGLYSSKNSIATWVRCVYNINGKAVEVPIYIESAVTAFPFPVAVNMETGIVTPAFEGDPTLIIEHDK